MPFNLPDLTHRADPALLPELMDGPCSYETFRDTVRDIAATTRFTRAYRPTLRFLEEAFSRNIPSRRIEPDENLAVNTYIRSNPRSAPLHLLDVGFGGGDVLLRFAAHHTNYHQPLTLTGIDLNPHAARAAAELSASLKLRPYARSTANKIQWITGDVFTDPAVQSPDFVLSSLVTHHMPDDEIIRFLRWMEDHARKGWFISDLVRSPRSYRLFALLSRGMQWHPFVQHDGLVSIRRAFREPDWHRLLAAAEVPPDAVTLRRCALGRLCLTRFR